MMQLRHLAGLFVLVIAVIAMAMVADSSSMMGGNAQAEPPAPATPSTTAATTVDETTSTTDTAVAENVPRPIQITAVDAAGQPLINAPIKHAEVGDQSVDCAIGGSHPYNNPCPGEVHHVVSQELFPAQPCVDGLSLLSAHSIYYWGDQPRADAFTNLVPDSIEDDDLYGVQLDTAGLREGHKVQVLLSDGSVCVGQVVPMPQGWPGESFPAQPEARFIGKKVLFPEAGVPDPRIFTEAVAEGFSASFLMTSTCAMLCDDPAGFDYFPQRGRAFNAIVMVQWDERIPPT